MTQEPPKPGAELVRVRDAWNGWRSAEVPLRQLRGVSWLRAGGAPHPMLHATVACNDIVTGTLPHPCESGNAPHQIQVCVVKSDVPASVYRRLCEQATGAMDFVQALSVSAPLRFGVRSEVPAVSTS